MPGRIRYWRSSKSIALGLFAFAGVELRGEYWSWYHQGWFTSPQQVGDLCDKPADNAFAAAAE
jgi:hypothetical protein